MSVEPSGAASNSPNGDFLETCQELVGRDNRTLRVRQVNLQVDQLSCDDSRIRRVIT